MNEEERKKRLCPTCNKLVKRTGLSYFVVRGVCTNCWQKKKKLEKVPRYCQCGRYYPEKDILFFLVKGMCRGCIKK